MTDRQRQLLRMERGIGQPNAADFYHVSDAWSAEDVAEDVEEDMT